MNKYQILLLSVFVLTLHSCQFFQSGNDREIVASVNKHKLFKEQLLANIPEKMTGDDSLSYVRSYIEKWANDKLIMDKAELNLPKSIKNEFDSLSKKYKQELYKKAYLDALVEAQAKTEIDSAAIVSYYEKNKPNFKLNENLMKIRYIKLRKDLQDISKIKKSFKNFSQEDQTYLANKSLEFKSLYLNDSTWVREVDIVKEFSVGTEEGIESELFKQNGFVETNLKDTFVFIFIKDRLERNDQAPLSYIEPTVKQVLINKMKLKVSKQIQQEIKEDAIQNNEYKLYE
ncbi:MAG: hypothetical protein ACTH3E_07440 [Psychroflexus halocasei]